MVKTLHFHCRGHGLDPWSDPTCLMNSQERKKKKRELKDFLKRKDLTVKYFISPMCKFVSLS